MSKPDRPASHLPPFTLVICGRSASGKSTLAAWAASSFGLAVIRVPAADRRAPRERERGVQVGEPVSVCRDNSNDDLEGIPARGEQARHVMGTEETLRGQVDFFHEGAPAFHSKPVQRRQGPNPD
jgi:hypothetical protein